MSTAGINNIDCYYEVHGKGRPLMLIGGLSSDSRTWTLALEHLKEHFQIIIFDNRGAGRTKYPDEDFDINILARDAVELLKYLDVKNADILGHSMGGYIAQEIAITYPEFTGRLILAGTSSFTSERNKSLFYNMLKMLEEDVSYELFLKELIFWLFTPDYFNDKGKAESFIKYIMEYPYRQTLDGFRRQVKAYTSYSSYDRLNAIKAETLILAGEKDILIPREETEDLSSGISNASVKYIEGAAHSLPVEGYKELVSEVIRIGGSR